MCKNIKSINLLLDNCSYKKNIMIFLVAMAAVMFSTAALSVQSLRGGYPLESDTESVPKHKVNTEEGGYDRNFKLQPPMIPHKTAKYRINLKNNGCLKCHSEKSYKKENAPKVGDSHYIDRDGKTLKTISKRRYFCTQCHAPQVKSKPLVKNTYEGID
ncbi:nitrate reductase cytochrome c-type subunit [sulfur-oxidizing endosymbiont of Gigantopelta aegis]|uniref:nitrate reductase cytochrome c-type subunit n=1 Tax=sulfur-oxidizing endosymbiont of Gigantopelta aegis TaxID=2794934 RepID=UPI0018DE0FF7|nr:nitrate reductase cytochrome c-type subunit [sulfur-oxidizing endosymbiont of Gigantopelta aegis]